jgi:hypothetical protein
MDTGVICVVYIVCQMLQYIQISRMERGFATAQAEVEAVETILSGLPFDLVDGAQAHISGTMVFGVAAGIRPTIAAPVITKSSQQPTHSEQVTVQHCTLSHTHNIIEWYFGEVVFTPF